MKFLEAVGIFMSSANISPCIFDLGISKLRTVEEQTMTRSFGSQKFMVPAILNKEDNYDWKVDVYSFSLIERSSESSEKLISKRFFVPTKRYGAICLIYDDMFAWQMSAIAEIKISNFFELRFDFPIIILLSIILKYMFLNINFIVI